MVHSLLTPRSGREVVDLELSQSEDEGDDVLDMAGRASFMHLGDGGAARTAMVMGKQVSPLIPPVLSQSQAISTISKILGRP